MDTMSKDTPSQSLVGRRVRLVRCNDRLSRIREGAEGTVSSVDDLGTLHVDWDDGTRLGLVWADGDRWMVVPKNKA